MILDVLDIGFAGSYLVLDLIDVLLRYLTYKFLILNLLVERIILTAIGYRFELLLVFLNSVLAVDDILLPFTDVSSELIDLGGKRSLVGLKGCNLFFESSNFLGELAAELEDLIQLGIGLLEVIKCLQFLLNAEIGIREILLQRYESLPLVDRGLDFFGLFNSCHIWFV